MAIESAKEFKLMYCYAREDEKFRDKLDRYLVHLKRRCHLTTWADRQIIPGEPWEDAIDQALRSADLILLLISPDFLASDYCYQREMQKALERHAKGETRVVPILLRPTYWEDAPI